MRYCNATRLVSAWLHRSVETMMDDRTEEVGLMHFIAGRKKRQSGGFVGTWIKSSLSQYNGNCVEVAGLADDIIRVRDSKDPRGGILSFTTGEWDAFIGGVRNGEFDRKPGSL